MSNLPELRFRGYKDSWGAAPLKGSLSFISYGFTNPMPEADNGPYMITAKEISGGKVNFKGARKTTATAFEELLTDKSRPMAGDILLTKDGSLGRLAVAGNELFCINQSVAVLRPITTAIPQFLYQLLSTPKYQSTMLRNAGGSTIKHIYITVVDKMEIATPTLPEQKKIADFLTSVDERIGQLIKKKALLEDYKKGVMQQLFSQQIRFKDDNGNEFPDWEEKTIDEIANFRRGSFPQPYGLKKWYDDENGFPFIQVYDVGKNFRLKDETKRQISDLAKDLSVFVPKGSIVITIQGSIGRIAVTQYDACCDRTLLIFTEFKVPIAEVYFVYALYLRFEIEARIAVGGTIKTITKEKLRVFPINLPSVAEQKKIADFLSAIDQKIESVSQQIAKTQTFKKGLLQQMFV